MKKSWVTISVFIIVFITLITLVLTLNTQSMISAASAEYTEPEKVNQQWVRAHSPIIGPDEAPVTLVEFIDPACEACRAMYPYVKQIMNRYPEQIRLVIRYVNFHDQSEEAVRILEAAKKQGQFQSVLEVLLAFQPAWAPHHKEGIDPWQFLTKTDWDIEQAKRDAKAAYIAEIIRLDMADVEAAGVKKTPSFFVNGKPLKLMHPDPLLEMIEAELNIQK